MHDQSMPPCPVCGKPSRLQFTKGGGFPYHSCDEHRIQALLLAFHAGRAEKKEEARFTLAELLLAACVAAGLSAMFTIELAFFFPKLFFSSRGPSCQGLHLESTAERHHDQRQYPAGLQKQSY